MTRPLTSAASEVVEIHEVSPLVTEDTRLAPAPEQRKTDVVTGAANPDGEAQPGNPPTDAVTEP